MSQTCLICGYVIFKPRKTRGQKFCSLVCVGRSQRKGALVLCTTCHQPFYAERRRLKRGYGKYCSMKCHPMYGTGPSHTNWKGGRRETADGYVEIRLPTHPAAGLRSYIFEHRVVMEKMLGRYLENKERVHHSDGIKANNSPDNLHLFPNESEHKKHHHRIGTYLGVRG